MEAEQLTQAEIDQLVELFHRATGCKLQPPPRNIAPDKSLAAWLAEFHHAARRGLVDLGLVAKKSNPAPFGPRW